MKTFFVTDAHLGSLATPDPLEQERKLVRWMDSIRPDCEALYLLGDMLDFWYEYKHAVPKGFTRFFGKIAEFTDAGIEVHWFIGNHDIWLFDYVQTELGVIVHTHEEEISLYGKRFFMAHGDGLGDPSRTFRILRSVFHSKTNQYLFKLLHPDLGLGFGLNWAKRSRLKRIEFPEEYLGEDREYLVGFSKKHALEHGDQAPDFYLFGHRHILLDLQISTRSRILIPGDWIHHFSYGVFDGKQFDLLLFEEPAE